MHPTSTSSTNLKFNIQVKSSRFPRIKNDCRYHLRFLTCFILFVSVGYSNIIYSQCNADDFSALRAIYFAMNGDNWNDTTGWNLVRNNQTPPPTCDLSIMKGIAVDNNNRVSSIILREDRSSGYIPNEIGDLLGLSNLTITDKGLYGPIPPEIGNLQNLESLKLEANNLSDEIPSEIGNLSNLTYLNLSSNKLSGSIPISIGNLSVLDTILFGFNQLSGSIPSEIGNLSKLKFIRISYNELSGGIPPELGNLPDLEILDFSNNLLTGSIPSSLGNLPLLDNLQLRNNLLTGCLDPNLKNLCTADIVAIAGNSINATWADFCATDAGMCDCVVGDWKALNKIYNDLGGPGWTNINTTHWQTIGSNTNPPIGFDLSIVPGIRLDDLGCVDSLRLRNKNLIGTIPTEIEGMFHLKSLNLSNNNISGNIIDGLGNLPALIDLRLQENALTGSINTNGFENLKIYSLSENQLDMPIPEDIHHLNRLEVLAINNNPLGGGLPATLGELPHLRVLHADTTTISGCFPPNLKKLCAQLTDVAIDNDNSLSASWAGFCAQELGICSDEVGGPIWIGRISDDWNISDNWENYSIPDADDDVIIPIDNTVHIYSNQTEEVRSINIGTNSYLNIYTNSSLSMDSPDADISNNGTINLDGTINSTMKSNDAAVNNFGEIYISSIGEMNIDAHVICLGNHGDINNEGLIRLSNGNVGIVNEGVISNDGQIIIDSTMTGIQNAIGTSLAIKGEGTPQLKMMAMGEIDNANDGIITISNASLGIINDDYIYNDGIIIIQASETAFINGVGSQDMSGILERNLSKAIASEAECDNDGDLIIRHCISGIVNNASFDNYRTIDMSHIDKSGISNLHNMLNDGTILIDSSGTPIIAIEPFFIAIINGITGTSSQEDTTHFTNEGLIEINSIEGGAILNLSQFTNEEDILIQSVHAGISNVNSSYESSQNGAILNNQGDITINDTEIGCFYNRGEIINMVGGSISLSQTQASAYAYLQDSIGTFNNSGDLEISDSGYGHMSIAGTFTNQEDGQVELSGTSTNGFVLRSTGHWINAINSFLEVFIENGDRYLEIENGGQMDGEYSIELGEEDR